MTGTGNYVLATANALIAELMEALRTDHGTREVRTRRVQELNAVLHGAMYDIPHYACGVEIVFAPGLYGRLEEIDRCYASDYKLQHLRRFGQAWTEKHGTAPPECFLVPLPYGFMIGPKGSLAARPHRRYTRDEVYFGEMHPHDRAHAHPVWGFDVPSLRLAIEKPVVSYMETSIPLDEILSVRFVSEGEPMPYYADTWDDERNVLLPRSSHLHGYLRFRDFASYQSWRTREACARLTDAEWKQCQAQLFQPDGGDVLWVRDWSASTQRMKHAFFAVWADKPEDLVLYELHDAPLLDENVHVAAATWFVDFHLRGLRPSMLRRYRGQEIVERLVQIPVKEARS